MVALERLPDTPSLPAAPSLPTTLSLPTITSLPAPPAGCLVVAFSQTLVVLLGARQQTDKCPIWGQPGAHPTTLAVTTGAQEARRPVGTGSPDDPSPGQGQTW